VQEKLALLDQQAPLAQLALLVLQVRKVLLGYKDQRVIQALEVCREKLDQQVPLEQMAQVS
jgi:transcriptional regulator GlxA family with amidase domain